MDACTWAFCATQFPEPKEFCGIGGVCGVRGVGRVVEVCRAARGVLLLSPRRVSAWGVQGACVGGGGLDFLLYVNPAIVRLK